jgi:hypothetical protein
MRSLFLLIALIIPVLLFAQEKELKFNFIESKSGEKAFPTNVTLTNKVTGSALNESNGVYNIRVNDNIVRLQVRDPYYASLDTLLDLNQFLSGRKRKLEFTIRLNFKGQLIQGVDVLSEYRPTIIFQSDTLHVQDFELISSESAILLTYPKKLQKGSRLLLYNVGEIKADIEVPAACTALKLSRDFQGNIYLHCQERIFKIQYTRSGLNLMLVDEAYYYDFVNPVVDTVESNYFVTNYSEWYPAFEYYGVNMLNPAHYELIKIQDDLMMELYRAEFKWADVRTKLWAWDMERETGVDREIWVGATQFTQSLYYEPLYAPLFIKEDTVFVFNHYKDSVYLFDGDFYNRIGSHPISYHTDKKKSGWRKSLIQDPVTQNIYIVYEQAGYGILKEFSTTTFSETGSYALHFRYAEKIRVFNGDVYYTYRPFESLQKKYLYKEPLNKMAGQPKVFQVIR